MNRLFTQFLNLIIALVLFLLVISLGLIFDNLLSANGPNPSARSKLNKNQQALKTKMFKDVERVENGIHVKTGLAWDKNLSIIRANCTSCHSAKLITQNRATKEGWEEMIEWMQETQGLHDLGENKDVIVSYLSKYYAPNESGRRSNLTVNIQDWYELE